MKNNKGIGVIGIILIIVGVLFVGGGVYYLGINSENNKVINENEIVTNEEVDNNLIKGEQNQVSGVYPLYSELSWNDKVASTNNNFGLQLSGYRIDSKIIKDEQYYKLDTSFQEYYDNKLTAEGWVRSNTLQADGAGSQLWGYIKDKKVILLSYDSVAIKQISNQPLSCPCNMTFSIFYGEKDEVATVKSSDIVGWKTYVNDKYGFSFNYPSVWSQLGDGTDVIGDIKTGSIGSFVVNFKNIDTKTQLTVEYYLPPNGVKLYNYAISQYKSSQGFYKEGELIKVAGSDAVKGYSVIDRSGRGTLLNPPLRVVLVNFLDNNNGSIQLYLNTSLPNEIEEVANFESLLSTFKFIK